MANFDKTMSFKVERDQNLKLQGPYGEPGEL